MTCCCRPFVDKVLHATLSCSCANHAFLQLSSSSVYQPSSSIRSSFSTRTSLCNSWLANYCHANLSSSKYYVPNIRMLAYVSPWGNICVLPSTSWIAIIINRYNSSIQLEGPVSWWPIYGPPTLAIVPTITSVPQVLQSCHSTFLVSIWESTQAFIPCNLSVLLCNSSTVHYMLQFCRCSFYVAQRPSSWLWQICVTPKSLTGLWSWVPYSGCHSYLL